MKRLLFCLTNVKTVISLAATFVFTYLAIRKEIPIETITMLIGMVFTYYFNHKEDDENGISKVS